MNARFCWHCRPLLFALVLVASPFAYGQANVEEPPTSSLEKLQVVIVDSNWSTPTTASDCATGMADDSWELQLSDAKQVTVSVEDCCCPGDYFEVYVNGNLIGTTPNLAPPWGCGFSGPLSTGSFTVPLCPGTHRITVRDAGFDGHSLDEILEQNMCPAGFTVSGTVASLSPLQASGATALPQMPTRVTAPAQSARDQAAAKRIREQMEVLAPFVTTDARGIQHLQVDDARRSGVSPASLRFGHKVIALNNRIIIAAQHGQEPDLKPKDFEFLEPYYFELAQQQQGDPCSDRRNPAACPPRIESGFCFATNEEVVDHLEAEGYHRTANYAGGAAGNDYSRIVAYPGCTSTDAFREQALIRQVGSSWTYNLQGPEPNPELLSYIGDWPYFSWPGYVRWWHLRFC